MSELDHPDIAAVLRLIAAVPGLNAQNAPGWCVQVSDFARPSLQLLVLKTLRQHDKLRPVFEEWCCHDTRRITEEIREYVF